MEREPSPGMARRLLSLLLPEGRRDEILGDLEEEFQARRRGVRRIAWYWAQVLTLGPALLWQRLRRRVGTHRAEAGNGTEKFTTGGGWMMGMGGWMVEAKITIRSLVRRPAYALLVLGTLVLGVGATTAAFGLLHEVVLRPLPFQEPDRLVALRTDYGGDLLGLTEPELLEVTERARTLESVAALVEPNLDADWIWAAGGERRPLDAVRVTDGFFRTLGVRPALGGLPVGLEPGQRTVVVSRSFWVTELGADPSVVGGTLQINGESYAVTAVLPADFEFPLGPEPMDVWLPYVPESSEPYEGMPLAYRGVGRLAAGASLDRARAEVAQILEAYRARVVEIPGSPVVHTLQDDLVGEARRPLVLLTAAGLLVLLVASLNLSMLVAARNVDRRDELAVRAALGASRGRILRHLLSEAGILALVGAGMSTMMVAFLLERISRSPSLGLERLSGLAVGPELVLVALLAAAVPTLLATTIPAFRVLEHLRLRSRGGSSSRSGRRFAWVLSGVESGAIFALLVVAVLVVRSLGEVTAVDPGFETSSTVAFTIFSPPEQGGGTTPEASAALIQAMEERVAALPGVSSVGMISNLPLSPESWSGSLQVEGREEIGADGEVVVDWELASPGYFAAMGIPVVQGRAFHAGDRPGAEPVALINETLARRWWPDGDPVGARISGGGPFRRVVGVVGDVKQQGLHSATRGFMYLPALQMGTFGKQEVVVRVAGENPGTVVGGVRAALLEVEPDLAVGAARTLDTLVEEASGSFRLRALLLGSFASMALLLGLAGIYGVTAHGVRRRRREIGIRMAMGADGGRILKGVLREALLPVGGGLLGGLVIVLVAAPALGGLLFEVEVLDPLVMGGIAVLLLTGGLAAVLPSAARARATDPAGMLREE